MVKHLGWTIVPRGGSLKQAVAGNAQNRIGIIENAIIRAGKHSAIINLEVVDLDDDLPFLLGMDLFGKLGFSVQNLPFSWPVEEKLKTQPTGEETNLEVDVPLPDGVDADGIAMEWKDVLQRNAALAINSTTTLVDAILPINTGDADPMWMRQYPILQVLMRKVRRQVELWIKNGWVVAAPIGCCWNSPLLAAPKLAKETGGKDDICLCLDARFLNKKIIDKPDM